MASKGKKSKQEEEMAAAKIKIMRERHSTWMKQREQALGKKGGGANAVKGDVLSWSSHGAGKRPPSANKNRAPSSQGSETSRSTKSVNARTQAGVKKISASSDSLAQQQSNGKVQAPHHPMVSASPVGLVHRNELYDKQQYQMKNKLSDSDSAEDALDKDKHRPITPNTINALADTVAERLRMRMRGESSEVGSPFRSAGMSSHDCAVCGKMMTAPLHTPTAVIPCGHTFCKTCVTDCNKCPTCQSRVTSTAVNTVLQQIISSFKEEKEKERLQQLEEQTRKYVNEYEGLTMRQEILTGEAESIIKHMESITQELMGKKQDMRKIERDNNDIKERIQKLQQELVKNSEQYEGCQEYCDELEEKYSQEKQQLAMVEDTIKTIKKSKERVKIMVHNFAPNLKLDSNDQT